MFRPPIPRLPSYLLLSVALALTITIATSTAASAGGIWIANDVGFTHFDGTTFLYFDGTNGPPFYAAGEGFGVQRSTVDDSVWFVSVLPAGVGSIMRYRPSTGVWSNWHANESGVPSRAEASAIQVDADGRLWVAYGKDGLCRLESDDIRWACYLSDGRDLPVGASVESLGLVNGRLLAGASRGTFDGSRPRLLPVQIWNPNYDRFEKMLAPRPNNTRWVGYGRRSTEDLVSVRPGFVLDSRGRLVTIRDVDDYQRVAVLTDLNTAEQTAIPHPAVLLNDVVAVGDELWFSTGMAGIAIWDGSDWRSITVADGLSSNYGRAIVYDPEAKKVYFGHAAGLSVISATDLSVVNYGPKETGVAAMGSGSLGLAFGEYVH